MTHGKIVTSCSIDREKMKKLNAQNSKMNAFPLHLLSNMVG